MKAIFRYVAILPVSCALCYGTRVNPPIYFMASDAASLGCQVLNSAGSPHITSNTLEFPDGQRIDFLNAQSGVTCTAEETESRLSVFAGQDPSKWRPNLPLSRRVRFRSVYPGVDLIYYGNGSHLEYDFEVAPRADASRIRLAFGQGAQLKLTPGGDLLVTANGSTLIHHRPRVYQGDRQIGASYAIDQNGAQVRIKLGKYDRSQSLIIDPVLAWQASFNAGGSFADAVAVDPGGNMWILSDFPAQATGFTNQFGPGGDYRDVLLFKVDPSGATLLYAVALGGAGSEYANGLAIGNDGSAYIVGSTSSTDFPVTAQAFQTSAPSITASAAFVTKLSPQGDSLVYSTYLGGTGGASAAAIAVDRDGNAFVAGTPNAPDFPLTTGSWEDHFSIYSSGPPYSLAAVAGGFIAKINTTGTALLYSTLVDERPLALTINSAGAAYVFGGFPSYSIQPNQYTLQVGNSPTMIMTRLTPDGAHVDMTVALSCLSPIIYSQAGLIALDSGNNILVAGATACATFPVGTSGAFQPQHAPSPPPTYNSTAQYDGLIVKIAADASTVLAATFLGGSDVDEIEAIRVASDDSVMVAGGTSSSDFPVTSDALNSQYGGGEIANAGIPGDGFFARLSPNLDRLIYSTWLGGTGADYITALALDLADNAYLGGASYNGLESPGVFTFNGVGPVWAMKFAHDMAAAPEIASVSPVSLEAGTSGATIQISGSNFAQNAVVLVNGTPAPTGFTSSAQLSATVSATSVAATGTLELRVLNPGSGASNGILLPVVAPAGMNPNPSIQSLLPNGLPAGSPGGNIIVTGSGFLASTTAAINGNARAALLNADSTLSVTLTQGDLSTAGTLNVTLTNPSPGGGVSAPASFLVAPALVPRQPPVLSSVVPSRPTNFGDTFMGFTVSGLSPSAVARWNGTDHSIDFVNARFTASAADLSHAGTAEVTIFDSATGLESNPLPVWIPFATNCTDMAWNPTNRRLYLSTANSVIVLNPDTGDPQATIPTDISIARLAISPDGGYLFAMSSSTGTLRRYQILAAAPWLANPLDNSISAIVDFAPVPGSPGSVAVYSSFNPDEIAIYDGLVKRPAVVAM
ncbi:MAG: IPT/TIG domain-containing protein, partial [Bryobacteraceae bacterium]